ncbi:MAG TPA: hypothetical protein VI792_03575 [Candidatus Eisenbacteria bacterium]
MASDPRPLSPADLDLLERLAARVVELRLEVAAILTLETARPLSVVASQAMIFFEPIAQALLPGQGWARLARLVERRDAVEALTRMIETRADAAHARRRAAAAARRAARRG